MFDFTRYIYTFRQTENGVCTIEEIGGEIFGHCEVYNPSLKALKEVKMYWGELKQHARDEGKSYLYSYNVNERFCKMLGKWEVIGEEMIKGKLMKVVQFPLYEELE